MLRIAFQGEPGAYSEAAGRQLFGKKVQLVPCEDFPGVFEKVKQSQVNYGIIPIENSLAGSIHQNYDLLLQTRFYTVKEVYLRIEHALLCHPQSRFSNLTEVLSHPQALSQCSGYLRQKTKLKPLAFYDTAGAAQYIASLGPGNKAAIASTYAAGLYKLKILRRNIEDNNTNTTRFLAISAKAPPAKKFRATKSATKTSLAFIPHNNEPGILFRVLGVFALRQINLLKIESRPLPTRKFEYCFYLDIEGHQNQPSIGSALQQLNEMVADLAVFGSYEVGETKKLL